jgi:hypothetical protein
MAESYWVAVHYCTLFAGLVPFETKLPDRFISDWLAWQSAEYFFLSFHSCTLLNFFPKPKKVRGDWSSYLSIQHCHFWPILLLYRFWSTLSTNLSICLSIYLSVCLPMAIRPLLDLGCFFSFLILYTVGRTPWTGDQTVARLLPAHRTAQTQNKRTQTSMPQVGFELMIPVFERAKTVHALDRAASVIGSNLYTVT